ncbi:glycosyltransferase family 2 protein [Demequina aurantiaca]|uniref:glycosyltransferase family 2 protein n=1 Tax=Demequina aurantiaca TaxID=676200 RepID=UPI003D32F11B
MNTIPAMHPLVASSLAELSLSQRENIAGAARLVLHRGLRDRADAARHVLAAGAQTGGTWESVKLVAGQALATGVEGLSRESAPWWRALGEITLLHGDQLDDQALAEGFFEVARVLDGHRHTNLMEYWAIVQTHFNRGGTVSPAALPPAPTWLPPIESDLIDLDVLASSAGRESGQWLRELNARIFEPSGLSPVRLRPIGRTLFDRVEGSSTPTISDGPLVSVVMTTFQRDEEILNSVRSILAQSWSNLELLIVDDASGPEFEPLLATLEGLDPRVRVIRQRENRGAYVGRNTALAQAQGEYVTFQDDDDWSHPQRIERQLAPLIDDLLVHSTLSLCLRTSEELRFRNSAAPASTTNSSSIMFRARDLSVLGGFDTVRKAGDTEFILRLKSSLPGHQVVVEETLAFVRLTQGSLSRTDFGPGRSHPTRQEYWESSAWWHSRISLGAHPFLEALDGRRSFPAPRRFIDASQLENARSDYEIVIAGDFGSIAPWLSRTWELLQLAINTNTTVGIIHLSDPAGQSGRLTRIAPEVRQLVNDGVVDRILPNDDVRIRSLVVADASVLEVQDPERWSALCSRVTLVADSQPAESGFSSLWSIRDVSANLASMFGATGCKWFALSEDIRSTLRAFGAECSERLLPFSVDPTAMAVAKRQPGQTPTIGRCTPPDRDGWPQSSDGFEKAYPADGTVDVRLYGDDRALNYASHPLPDRWLVLPSHASHFAAFIQQLDFYVYFAEGPPSRSEFRAMLVALAAGRVVLVDSRFASQFGDAVVSCTSDSVVAVIKQLHHDESEYERQVRRGRQLLRSRSPGSDASHLLTQDLF